jgi:hypothetical protein
MLRVVLKQLVLQFPVAAALVALFDREADLFTVKVQEPSVPGADPPPGRRGPDSDPGDCGSSGRRCSCAMCGGGSALDRAGPHGFRT